MNDKSQALLDKAINELTPNRQARWLAYCYGVMSNRVSDGELELISLQLENDLKMQGRENERKKGLRLF